MNLSNLNPNLWFIRWFFWSMEIWDAFRDKHDWYHVRHHGTNLCHFVRVTIIYAPLILLLHAWMYLATFAALTVVPIVVFGFAPYAAFVVALSIIIGAVWVSKKYSRQKVSDKGSRLPADIEPELDSQKAAMAPAAPGFFAILWHYVVAGKQKICPTITFKTV